MTVDAGFPEYLARHRVDAIGVGTPIAEKRHPASTLLGDGDGGTNWSVRAGHPVNAARRCIEGIDAAALASHENAPAHHGRLRGSSGIPREPKSPLQF